MFSLQNYEALHLYCLHSMCTSCYSIFIVVKLWPLKKVFITNPEGNDFIGKTCEGEEEWKFSERQVRQKLSTFRIIHSVSSRRATQSYTVVRGADSNEIKIEKSIWKIIFCVTTSNVKREIYYSEKLFLNFPLHPSRLQFYLNSSASSRNQNSCLRDFNQFK